MAKDLTFKIDENWIYNFHESRYELKKDDYLIVICCKVNISYGAYVVFDNNPNKLLPIQIKEKDGISYTFMSSDVEAVKLIAQQFDVSYLRNKETNK